MENLKQTSNCNGTFPNKRTAMAYLETTKVVVTYIE
jgi:hypothetical protein